MGLMRGERTGLLTDTSALVCACRRLILVPPGRSSRCDAQLCGTLRAQLVADMANNPALVRRAAPTAAHARVSRAPPALAGGRDVLLSRTPSVPPRPVALAAQGPTARFIPHAPIATSTAG